MANWYVDADAGNDTTGDGLSWGTAWAGLVKAFGSIPTPSPAETQNIHVKGSHSIPSGGWTVTSLSQPWAWAWNLYGYDDATITRTGVNIFAAGRNMVSFSNFNIISNLAIASYTAVGNLNKASYIRCAFSRIGAFSYEGGLDSRLIECSISSNVYIYGPLLVERSLLLGYFSMSSVVTNFIRCRGVLNINYGTNENEIRLSQCSLTNIDRSGYTLRRFAIDRSVIAAGSFGEVSEISDSAIGTGVTYSGATPNGIVTSDDLFSSGYDPSEYVSGLSISNPLTIGAIQASSNNNYNPFKSVVFGS